MSYSKHITYYTPQTRKYDTHKFIIARRFIKSQYKTHGI